MKKIVALIPMKGHSERVKNKNLKKFSDLPLYHIVAKNLLQSTYISQLVVDTDSHEIASDINKNFSNKITIIDRPEIIRGDRVSMNKIIAYDISRISADIYLQTHSTNPLLTRTSIDRAIQTFLSLDEKKYDSLFSVTKLQTRLYHENSQPINHDPNQLIRTQDLAPLYQENSCLYLFTAKSFSQSGSRRIGKKPYLFVINKIEAMDIDDPEDFVIAQQMYKILRTI